MSDTLSYGRTADEWDALVSAAHEFLDERARLGRDFPARGYMLSALVIYLDGNDAGSGFYALATRMGLLESRGDRLAFWTEQLKGLTRK